MTADPSPNKPNDEPDGKEEVGSPAPHDGLMSRARERHKRTSSKQAREVRKYAMRGVAFGAGKQTVQWLIEVWKDNL